MAKYKLEIADGCISCGLCVATCPDLFEMKEQAVPIKSIVENITCAKKAAENCPVKAIHIADVKTKKQLI